MELRTLFIAITVLLAAGGAFAETETMEQNTRKELESQFRSIRSEKVYENYETFNMMGDSSLWSGLKDWFGSSTIKEPKEPLESAPIDAASLFSGDNNALRATWLGHSSFLVELDGLRILLDPVLFNDTSPVSWLYSVKRFQKKAPLSPADLPFVDVAIISHDHYDHLCRKTIQAIRHKVKHFVVPKGVDGYLKKWDVAPVKITTLDWSETFRMGKHRITALPGQHFSGRGLWGRNKTLWASWAIVGPYHKLYFSGDSGYFDTFKRIGEAFGPFDLVILDSGQFGVHWPKVHMFPEEAVQAHIDLKGKVYIPAHWGSFNLATHNWWDPIERAVAAAREKEVDIAIPYPGETVVVGEELPKREWWRELK